jgi:threonine synthase
VYYFSAYFQWCKLQNKELMKDKVSFVVPSGNFGNALAGFYAKRMGLPINKFVIATNHNDILHRLIAEGDYSKKDSVPSKAPAMDITVPSNFERYLFWLGGDAKTLKKWMGSINSPEGRLDLSEEHMTKLRSEFSSGRATNDQIDSTVAAIEQSTGITLCTHTAVGVHTALNHETQQDLICFATAHHGKFGETIAESLNKKPDVPEQLTCLENKVSRCVSCPNDSDKLKSFLLSSVIEKPTVNSSCDISRLAVGVLALAAAISVVKSSLFSK